MKSIDEGMLYSKPGTSSGVLCVVVRWPNEIPGAKARLEAFVNERSIWVGGK